MDKKAIAKAQSRFRVAEKAISDFAKCQNFDAFDDCWYTFLTAAKNIYTVLEQGAKSSAQSKQWFGAKAAERRNDPLLQYVYQSRNDDEHGLERVTERVPGKLMIGKKMPGSSGSMSVSLKTGRHGEVVDFKATAHDGKPIIIEEILPHVKLIKVTTRGVTFSPPQEHKGAPLADTSPVFVAKLSLDYLSSLIKEAEALA